MNIKLVKWLSLILGIISWLIPFIFGFFGKISVKFAMTFFIIGGLLLAIHLFIDDIYIKYHITPQLSEQHTNDN